MKDGCSCQTRKEQKAVNVDMYAICASFCDGIAIVAQAKITSAIY